MEFSYACSVASFMSREKNGMKKMTEGDFFLISCDMKTFYADAFIMKLYMNNSLCLHDDDDDVCGAHKKWLHEQPFDMRGKIFSYCIFFTTFMEIYVKMYFFGY